MDLGSGAILLLDVTAVVALLAKIGLRYTGVWVGRIEKRALLDNGFYLYSYLSVPYGRWALCLHGPRPCLFLHVVAAVRRALWRTSWAPPH
ncbi:hypothetical protein PGIGA_G00128850 [Pangasianodon gigas]|uniref:Uncharacterized protein n=1 Tax=Pangasianodon gigas TaxID=30993 RepID=A0ACC5XIA6_PANGG|nr:hypothetical protein [Pangasianodon gigas]